MRSLLHKNISRAFLGAIGLSLLVTLALGFNLSPWLRGGAGWRWPYEVPSATGRLLPGIIVAAIYLSFIVWQLQIFQTTTDAIPRKTILLFGLLCAIGGIGIQIAFLAFHNPNPLRELFMRTVSEATGGFFEVGVGIEQPVSFLRNYPSLMSDFSVHPRAHPPGIPLLFWLLSRVFENAEQFAGVLCAGLRQYQCDNMVIMNYSNPDLAAATLGMILPVFSILTLWPLYKLANLLFGQQTALRSIALWPLTPALVMFVPQWNQFHPFFTVLALWLLVLGLRRELPGLFLLSGIVMSVATFISFTNLATLGLLGLFVVTWTAVRIRGGEWTASHSKRLMVNAGLFCSGVASLWILYYLVANVGFLQVLRTSLQIHYDLGHPYLPWLVLLPVDYWLFGGYVVGILAILEIFYGRKDNPELSLAWGLSLLGITLSGVVRGEVGRLLLWLMPLGTILAANFLTRLSGLNMRLTWAASGILAVQLVTSVAFLRVIDSGLSLPPKSSPIVQETVTSRPVNAVFDQSIELVSFEAVPSREDNSLHVDFLWKSQASVQQAYYMGMLVVGPNGEIMGQLDWLGGSTAYPTTCWDPDQPIPDSISIPLDAMLAGEYWLSLRVFDSYTENPLPVEIPGLPQDTQVGLGPILVGE